MKKRNEFIPDYLVSPGNVLKEYFDHFNLTPFDLSKKTNLDIKIINGILNGKEPITREIATSFFKIFKRPIRFWMNLERQYQEDKERLGP